ncbi:MAG: ATP-binding cassette domain-containing protein [Firmicutes bacterium]|nr:ATP-binding cassette domain-containing protein [Bacillota bacterium]
MNLALEVKVKPIVEARDLKKHFTKTSGLISKQLIVKAVDGISFFINPGETLGLVGESGCGKTTVGRTLVGLYKPTSGHVFYKDEDLFKTGKIDQALYRRQMQMIFQDPYSSLNPRMTVGDIVGEPIDIHKLAENYKERTDRVQQLLGLVGLNPEHVNRYPHEFSGGQRQRIGIARALAVKPELIVCDEPISAVDVSIQAQIVNMLEELQEELGLTYLVIAHDLSMIRYISNRVAVMYLGKFVELISSENLYSHPQHPYTKALISAVPIADPTVERKRKRIILEGDVPSPINPPSGCYFHTRCSRVLPICREVEPGETETGPNQWVACHNPG